MALNSSRMCKNLLQPSMTRCRWWPGRVADTLTNKILYVSYSYIFWMVCILIQYIICILIQMPFMAFYCDLFITSNQKNRMYGCMLYMENITKYNIKFYFHKDVLILARICSQVAKPMPDLKHISSQSGAVALSIIPITLYTFHLVKAEIFSLIFNEYGMCKYDKILSSYPFSICVSSSVTL